MFIYQIGNVVIKGILEHSTPLSWRGEAVQTSQQSRVKFTNFYTLPDITQAQLTGTLYAQEGLTVTDQHRRLAMMGGVPYVDVIGYTPNSLCHDGCVDWWYTYGMITSMPRPYVGPGALDSLELDLEITLNPQWVPLPQFIWGVTYGRDEIHAGEFVVDYSSITSDIISGYRVNSFPCDPTPWEHGEGFRFVKSDSITSLPSFPLQDSADYLRYWDYAEKGFFNKYDPVLSGDPNPTVFVAQNPYGGDIDTFYCFSWFNSGAVTGTITIDIDSELTPGNIINHVSTLDLAAMVTEIGTAEYGSYTMGNGSHIICSNNDLAPSYIAIDDSLTPLRSTITGEVYRPNWSYDYRCPGELIGFRNEVTLTVPLAVAPNSIKIRNRHLYRTV